MSLFLATAMAHHRILQADGQLRTIPSTPASAQSACSLLCSAESAIKTTVLNAGSAGRGPCEGSNPCGALLLLNLNWKEYRILPRQPLSASVLGIGQLRGHVLRCQT